LIARAGIAILAPLLPALAAKALPPKPRARLAGQQRGMETMNRKGWRIALARAEGQCIMTMAMCALLLLTSNARYAWAALFGGGVGAVANLAMGAYMFLLDANNTTPRAMLRGLYFGHIIKLSLIGALTMLAILWAEVYPPAFILAFVVALAAQWMLPGAFGDKRKDVRS